MINELPHSRFQHVYAIVRINIPVDQENPGNSVAVVKVFQSKMAADQEVVRLNETNKEKECRYNVHVTRLVP